ncbi:MAG: hypothetical protein H7176_08390 [Bdellovibrionales bacterium]|nr:hypothetical protein [Massilia sp.]
MWQSLIACALIIAAAGISAYGTKRWNRATLKLTEGLETARISTAGKPPRPTRFDSRELEGLRGPVQRYFRAVLVEGQPIIDAATIDMTGTFNMAPSGEQWRPFSSRQRVVTRRPGFLWDAQIAMLPGLKVRVVDSYIAGQGLLHAALFGVFTMAKIRGGGEIARGEFMRFFAEAAWYPTALLPGQGVQWEAVDDGSANATLVDGALALTLLFRFNDAGLIDSFRAEARGGATVGKEMVMLPWEGRFSNYQTHGGMKVPMQGEVAWMRPEGRKPYFVGTITAAAYEFAP